MDPAPFPYHKFKMHYADLNSLHLWQCSQSDEFNATSNHTYLTSAQQQDRETWNNLAYFGVPLHYSFHHSLHHSSLRLLDERLPDLKTPHHSSIRQTLAATKTKIKRLNVGLGVLDRLPPEILDSIISSLDISAVDQFKGVNRRGFEIVDTHTQFSVLNSQAHGTLRAIRVIKIGHTITVQALFEKLCESECNECGDYAGYMYLATLERVCFRCFTKNDRFVPLNDIDASKRFGLTPEVLRTVPHFRCFPRPPSIRRMYPDGLSYKQNHIWLVDCESARRAGIAYHGSFESMEEYVANPDADIWKSYSKTAKEHELRMQSTRNMREEIAKQKKILNKPKVLRKKAKAQMMAARVKQAEKRKRMGNLTEEQIYWFHYWSRHQGPLPEAIKDVDEETIDNLIASGFKNETCNNQQIPGNVEESKTEFVTDSDSSDDDQAPDTVSFDEHWLRCMAILRVPWLNRKSRRGEWGFQCIGCKGFSKRESHTHREFIMSTFRAHLMEFGPIINGVHHNNDCCNKNTCKTPNPDLLQHIHDRPFSRC